jgi:hypothetical protein
VIPQRVIVAERPVPRAKTIRSRACSRRPAGTPTEGRSPAQAALPVGLLPRRWTAGAVFGVLAIAAFACIVQFVATFLDSMLIATVLVLTMILPLSAGIARMFGSKTGAR